MSIGKFSKSALDLDQQISLLKQQGLVINDEELARHILKVVGYYRFSGYLLPFKSAHQSGSTRVFRQNTSIDSIWQLYQFDRELRLLVSDAIEKIEIAFRAALVEVTSTEFGLFWYAERGFYRDGRPYDNLMREVNKILANKQEVFIQHYLEKYLEPEYPPIWMMVETLSFGGCSKMFSNIQSLAIRRKICEIFEHHPTVIESWMKTTVWIRNLCAHHARLWNRWLVDAPIIPKEEPLHDYLVSQHRRFIVCAYILRHLLQRIAPRSHWQQKLYDLFETYEAYPGAAMGFSADWRDDPFWG